MRRTRISLAVLLLLATVACIHKTGGTVTPMERVTTDNALFAQINNSVEQGAEAVAASGLLTPQQVAPVIAWTGQVAQAHQQITAIMAKGDISAADLVSVQALVAQIQQSGLALVNSGTIGIKNPKSQQTISADVTAVTNLAETILAELTQIRGAN